MLLTIGETGEEHDNPSPKINKCKSRQPQVIRKKKVRQRIRENIILIKADGNENDIEQ